MPIVQSGDQRVSACEMPNPFGAHYTNLYINIASVKAQAQYGYAWMCDAVRSRQEMERGKFEPRDELRRYLKGPLTQGVANIVGYWGVHRFCPLKVKCTLNFAGQHQTLEYPTLSRMACDYLAIQGSATPSERAFSGGGITGTAN